MLDSDCIDRKATDLLTFLSLQIENIVAKSLKLSMSNLFQRTHVDILTATEEIVSGFKEKLGDELLKFCNNWEKNNLLVVVPEGTRLLKTIGASKLLVVEQKPTVRTVHFNSILGCGYYKLAFPYVVFLMWFEKCQYKQLQVAYAKAPLKTINSVIYRSNLPNIDENCVCCMGDALTKICGNDFSLSTAGNAIIKSFWGSTFNNDLSGRFIEKSITDVKFENLKAWAEESEKNPLFVMNRDWGDEYYLSTLIESSPFTYASQLQFNLRVHPIMEEAVKSASDALRKVIEVIPNQEAVVPPIDIRFRKQLYSKVYDICCAVLREADEISPSCPLSPPPYHKYGFKNDIW